MARKTEVSGVWGRVQAWGVVEGLGRRSEGESHSLSHTHTEAGREGRGEGRRRGKEEAERGGEEEELRRAVVAELLEEGEKRTWQVPWPKQSSTAKGKGGSGWQEYSGWREGGREEVGRRRRSAWARERGRVEVRTREVRRRVGKSMEGGEEGRCGGGHGLG